MTARRAPPDGLAPRLAAARRLQEVLGGVPFSPLVDAEIADPRDRALANRLATVALRRHGQLTAILAELLERGLPPRSGLFEAALRIGLVQVLFLDAAADHSAVHLAVETVRADRRARRFDKLANAVLRQAQRDRARHAARDRAELLPAWLAARWTNAYGAEAVERFIEALLDGAPLDLTLRDDDPALLEALGAVPVAFDTVRLPVRDRPVADLPGYGDGRWWVQDAAAAMPARLFALPAGAEVLDLCAAPGGKTAQLVKAGYRVTALDADANRAARLKDNLDRLGMTAGIVVADAAAWRPTAPVDGVLLDAPCSATGTFRRHPEVLWHRREADLAARAQLQRTLLAGAAECLKPGGRLVFCTCSLEPEEGEAIAAWAGTLGPLSPLPFRAGELGGYGFALSAIGHLRIHPGQAAPGAASGTQDGFFAARFERR